MSKNIPVILFLCMANFNAGAQSLPAAANTDVHKKKTEKVTGTFSSTRVINAHSTEMLPKGTLDLRILHRFGFVNTGIKQFWGLDEASMRLGFDYGLSDRLMVGIGRSTYRKELDAFIKYRILQQAEGAHAVPVTIAVAPGYLVQTASAAPLNPSFSDRSSYYIQLIIGRKFSSKFSLQLSPIWVHINQPLVAGDDKNIYALGFGGRYKFSKKMSLTFDYHHPGGVLNSVYTNPLGVGIDIETSGHTFQLHFSNATGMNERAYVTETTGKFFKGDIRFGFNLSRKFRVGKHRS